MYKKPQPQTVCQHLFNHLYTIEIQHSVFYTPEHRASLPGMNGPSSTDEGMQHWLNDTIQVLRSPVQMVEMFEQGVPFMLVYAKDLLEIYQKFNQHLLNWKNKLDQPFCAKRPPPPGDFLKIENFLYHIGHAAEAIARKHHFLGVASDKLKSEETELWDFLASMGNNYSVKTTIAKQADNSYFDIQYLERPVSLKEVWDKSSWSKVFMEEQSNWS